MSESCLLAKGLRTYYVFEKIQKKIRTIFEKALRNLCAAPNNHISFQNEGMDIQLKTEEMDPKTRIRAYVEWEEGHYKECCKAISDTDCLQELLFVQRRDSGAEFFSKLFEYQEDIQAPLFHWPLPLVHICIWLLVYPIMIGGAGAVVKVGYVTLPIACGLVLFFLALGLYLDSRAEFVGFRFYSKVEACVLKDPQAWLAVMGQLFMSLSLGWGGMMTLGSHNTFRTDSLSAALMIGLFDGLISVVAGVGMFGLIGHLATQTKINIEELNASGAGLVFVVIAQSLATLPTGNLWAPLFYLQLCLLAFGTQVCHAFCVHSFVFRSFPDLFTGKWRFITVFAVSSLLCILGLPAVSRHGVAFVDFIDQVLNNFTVWQGLSLFFFEFLVRT